MLRSIAAVLFGFVLIFALSTGATMVLGQAMPTAFDAAGRADSVPVLLLMMGYVALFAVIGCYLTARLAPGRPMLHALVLGVMGLAVNVASAVAAWDDAPVWVHVASLALVMPYAWIGGRLREVELERNGAGAPIGDAHPA